MKCKYCNVEITHEASVCPLCHEKLPSSEPLPSYFPQRHLSKPKKSKMPRVVKYYTFSFTVILVVCLTVNLLCTPTIPWTLVVASLLGYGIFLMKNTILSTLSIAQKIFWQAVYVMLILWSIQTVIAKGIWIWAYGLPFVMITMILSMHITLIVEHRFAKNYFLATLALSLLCYLPIILFACKVYTVLWPSLTVSIIGTVSILFVIIFGYRSLYPDFKKKFHF